MNKKLLIACAILLALFLIYWFVFRNKEDKPEEINLGVFPLKYGAKGKEVEQLQGYLIREYGAQVSLDGRADGTWGDLTEAAAVKFLKRNNVSKDFFEKTKMNEIKTTVY